MAVDNQVTTEFLINSTWTDYSDRVRVAAPGGPITITRGLADQQSSLSAQTSDFTLNNRDGLFTNRNPNSPLYGLIPRNTQVRHTIEPRVCHLQIFEPVNSGSYIFTADKASLDITTDLDIRIEITPDSWRPGNSLVLAGKYVPTGNQRSWMFRLRANGRLAFVWSPTGSSTTIVATSSSSIVVPADSTRLAVRILFDADNGAGSNVAKFYTAPGISGPWTQLGGDITTAGATSIFASTAPLEVGGADSGQAVFAGDTSFYGKVHAFELYNAAGTLVADMDPGALEPGETAWSDGLASANTWIVQGSARVTSDMIRFCGEVSSWPQKWDLTGRDVYVPVRANGALGRIMQGGQPSYSPLRRHLTLYESIHAYWPMEASSGATTPDAATNTTGMTYGGLSFTGSTPNGLAGSAGACTVAASGYMYLNAVPAPVTGQGMALCYFKLPSLPASSKVFIHLKDTGTIYRMELAVSSTSYTFTFYNGASAVLDTFTVGFGAGATPTGQWIGMQILLTESPVGTITWEALWHAVGSSTIYVAQIGGRTFSGNLGALKQFWFSTQNDAALTDSQLAHVLLTTSSEQSLGETNFVDASKAFLGETAGRRIERLAQEEGMLADFYGDIDDTEPMGVQTVDTVISLMESAASVDGGILAEARDRVGIQYVSRTALGDRYGETLDYSGSYLATTPDPVEDLRYLLNDVTANNPSGGAARAEITSGPLSVNDPPNGVGRIAGAVSRHPEDDTQLAALAQWEAFWRTWDEYRIPNVIINMNRSEITTALYPKLYALDMGHGIIIADPPATLPPGDVRLIVFGYSEQIDQFQWVINFNTVPWGPYNSRRIQDSGTTSNDNYPIMDSADGQSVLDASITDSATSLTIEVINGVTSGQRWINSTSHASEFPRDIVIGGEIMTMTACTIGAASGSHWQQTATVTRSVNGIVKAHSANAEIRIADPAYFALGA